MVTRTFGRRAAGLSVGWLVLLLLVAGCGGGGSESTTLALPEPVDGAAQPWVTTDGPHFVDASGRPVVLRGVDVGVGAPAIYERAPQLGVNFARIFVAWSQVEPVAPTDGQHHFDERVLSALDREVEFFQKARVNVLIDFHQFLWSPYFGHRGCTTGCSNGSGVPSWYYADGRFPRTPAGASAAKSAFWTTEAPRSLRAYAAFAEMMARRYARFPNVMGYEIFNEPHPGGLQDDAATQDILRWQAQIRRVLRAVDPTRTAVIMCRGGGNGVGTADLSPFGSLDHLALDFHDYFNGKPGTGLTPDGDDWRPSWAATHNQRSGAYTGTEEAQKQVLDVPARRASHWGIPLIVGEWGVRGGTPGSLAYGQQMLDVFDQLKISWARWTLGGGSQFALYRQDQFGGGGGWTPEALQLRQALTG